MAVLEVLFSPGVKKFDKASTRPFGLTRRFLGSNLMSEGIFSNALLVFLSEVAVTLLGGASLSVSLSLSVLLITSLDLAFFSLFRLFLAFFSCSLVLSFLLSTASVSLSEEFSSPLIWTVSGDFLLGLVGLDLSSFLVFSPSECWDLPCSLGGGGVSRRGEVWGLRGGGEFPISILSRLSSSSNPSIDRLAKNDLAAVFLTTSGTSDLTLLMFPWGCIPRARRQSSQFQTFGLLSGLGWRQE